MRLDAPFISVQQLRSPLDHALAMVLLRMVKSVENNTYQYRSNKLIGQGPQVTSKYEYIAYPQLRLSFSLKPAVAVTWGPQACAGTRTPPSLRRFSPDFMPSALSIAFRVFGWLLFGWLLFDSALIKGRPTTRGSVDRDQVKCRLGRGGRNCVNARRVAMTAPLTTSHGIYASSTGGTLFGGWGHIEPITPE